MSVSLQTARRSETAVVSDMARHVYWLSIALAIAGALTTVLTFFLPDVLTGPAVTNGNARGTALVMLTVGIPTMLIAMKLTADGSWRAPLVWVGALAYLLYNTFLLLFLTPFNSLFLLYVATCSLCLFSVGALLRGIDAHALADRARGIPARGLAIYAWIVVFLNVLAWLRVVLPALSAEVPASFMDGTGVATNPIYVQDLVFWLPLAAVVAWWLWNRRPWGYALMGGWLVYGVMESIGVMSDQWFGHRADPNSSFASEAGILMFAVLGVIQLVPLYLFFRRSRSVTTNRT